MAVRVKICGVTRPEDAELAVALGAEMIGLNFHPPSPRSLSLERAGEIARAIADRAMLVGVFVNAPRALVEERRLALGLGMLQFHGDEADEALAGWPIPVIRVLRLRGGAPVPRLDTIRADYVMLDTFDEKLFGGTGRARPLDELSGIELTRVFLSGGLGPDNVGAAAALGPYAVDVASGIESAPGIKDAAKLRSFIANAKLSR